MPSKPTTPFDFSAISFDFSAIGAGAGADAGVAISGPASIGRSSAAIVEGPASDGVIVDHDPTMVFGAVAVALGIDEILSNIIQQLDPTRLVDRDALLSLLTVSRRLFEVAAEQLWSRQELATNEISRFPYHAVLGLVNMRQAGQAPSGVPTTGPSRAAVYLRSIRTLRCVDLDHSFFIPHEWLLPCLGRLDTLDVTACGVAWGSAVAAHVVGAGSQRPRHVCVSTSEKTRGIRGAILRGAVKSVAITVDNCRDDLSEVMDGLVRGGEGAGIEAISILGVTRAEDMEAIGRCLEANAGSLRWIEVATTGLLSCWGEVQERLRGVTRVRHLRIMDVGDRCGRLVGKLVRLSRASLEELSVKVPFGTWNETFVAEDLANLRSLTLQLSKWTKAQELLTPMIPTMLTSLRVDSGSCSLDSRYQLLEAVVEMRELRELRVCILVLHGSDSLKSDLRLRLRNLRTLTLKWTFGDSSKIRLQIIDWEEITMAGLPLLEERSDRRPPPEASEGRTKTDKAPNQYVVLQGLSTASTEEKIQADLEALDACVETVRVIRDRRTGGSRGFAFVRFMSMEHARIWLEANYPHVMIDGARVKIDYSNNSPHEDDDWVCKKCGIVNFKRRERCFQCKSNREEAMIIYGEMPMSALVNDGSQDVGNEPTNLLLAIGLDPLTTEETLFKCVRRHAVVNGVRIVRDRTTKISWGFGFVEFPDVSTATRMLSLMYKDDPLTLEVDGHSISLAYSKARSFEPVYTPSPWVTLSQDAESGAVVYQQYWDQNAFASSYPTIVVADSSSAAAVGSNAGVRTVKDDVFASSIASVIKPPQKKTIEDDLAEFYADSAVADAPPEETPTEANAVEVPVEDMRRHGSNESTTSYERSPVRIKHALTDDDRWRDASNAINAVSNKVWCHSNIFSYYLMQIAKQLEKWKHLQGSLKEPEGDGMSPDEHVDISEGSLAKSLEDLTKHQLKSGMHKLREEADQRHYRNRAAERRKMYNQPKRAPPERELQSAPPVKRPRSNYSSYGMQRAQAILETPLLEEDKPKGLGADNKGSKLLKAMGWKEGQGLGARNEGIVQPVEAISYARGAGVGSAKMDELIRAIIEEIALENTQADTLKDFMWPWLVNHPELQFVLEDDDGDISQEGTAFRRSIQAVLPSALQQQYGDKLKIRATDEAIRLALGLRDATMKLGDVPYSVLAAVAKARARGATAADLAKDLKIDPSVKFPVIVRGTFTNLCMLRKFAAVDANYLEYMRTHNEGDAEKGDSKGDLDIDRLVENSGRCEQEGDHAPRWEKGVSYHSENVKQKITLLLSTAKNNAMIARDLIDILFNGKDPTKYERRWFNRILTYLTNGGFIEKVNVPKQNEKAGYDRCIKLIKRYVPLVVEQGNFEITSGAKARYLQKRQNDPDLSEILGEGGVLADLPIEYQVYRLICLSGDKGATSSVLMRSLNNMANRVMEKILKRLLKPATDAPAPIRSENEFSGREKRYRYFSTESYEAAVARRLALPDPPDHMERAASSLELAQPKVVERTGWDSKPRRPVPVTRDADGENETSASRTPRPRLAKRERQKAIGCCQKSQKVIGCAANGTHQNYTDLDDDVSIYEDEVWGENEEEVGEEDIGENRDELMRRPYFSGSSVAVSLGGGRKQGQKFIILQC
ncbi:hypothetical protein HK101_004382 [Irineochytrium annulatum]|nr:hypothetical protein HK101_004382 [Irineochytrium annulatum]